MRYELRAGVDAWDVNRRTVSIGGGLQRRLAHDRVALFGDVDAWMPIDGDGFRSASARALFNSSTGPARWLFTADAGVDGVTRVGAARPLAGRRRWTCAACAASRSPAAFRWRGHRTRVRTDAHVRQHRAAAMARARHVRALRGCGLCGRGAGDAAFGNEDPRAQLDVGVGLRLRVPGSARGHPRRCRRVARPHAVRLAGSGSAEARKRATAEREPLACRAYESRRA